jgi:hypothetical protein
MEEQGHCLLAGPADGEAPVLGMGILADLREQGTPGRAVVGARVDEHAVHVEDDRHRVFIQPALPRGGRRIRNHRT